MPLWMVRAGRHGEQEQAAIDNGFVTIGWNELSQPFRNKNQGRIEEIIQRGVPWRMTIANEVGEIWRFLKEINIGDLVALPLKNQSAIAVGKVTGSYEYRKDFRDIIRHLRKVDSIKVDIPKLYSFSFFS